MDQVKLNHEEWQLKKKAKEVTGNYSSTCL